MNLQTEILGMKFKNPILPAAGPPIKDAKAAVKALEGGVGGFVTKTVSVKPAQVPKPCMIEIKGGFLNAELWSELTLEQWLATEYPAIKALGLPVIVGLGYTAEDIEQLAPVVAPYADCLELSTHYLKGDTSPVENAVKKAKSNCDLPVIVKLSPAVDIPLFAQKAVAAGADGLALINSVGPCLDIDLTTGAPLLGSANGYGWLSGRAIFPIALRAVYQAAAVVDVPIFGVGGIENGEDVAKMIMAGAKGVQICTAPILKGPTIYGKIADELAAFMTKHGYQSLDEFYRLTHRFSQDKDQLATRIPAVNEQKCTACARCVKSCPYQAITLAEVAIIDSEACFGCGLCISRCPFSALSF